MCCPLYSTVLEDAGIEPGAVATFSSPRPSNHSSISSTQQLDLIHMNYEHHLSWSTLCKEFTQKKIPSCLAQKSSVAYPKLSFSDPYPNPTWRGSADPDPHPDPGRSFRIWIQTLVRDIFLFKARMYIKIHLCAKVELFMLKMVLSLKFSFKRPAPQR